MVNVTLSVEKTLQKLRPASSLTDRQPPDSGNTSDGKII